jgi:hypothetical protein
MMDLGLRQKFTNLLPTSFCLVVAPLCASTSDRADATRCANYARHDASAASAFKGGGHHNRWQSSQLNAVANKYTLAHPSIPCFSANIP